MINWSLIVLGLVALSSVTFAENSYLIIAPKLLKVGYDNQISVFIASASQPVEVNFDLILGQKHFQVKTICKSGETRNATLALPKEFPIGAGELTITGTGGLHFEEKRDVIVYDNCHVMLVQTSASTYIPRDTIEIRVVATNENLIPIENGELTVEIYDAAFKLVGEFPHVPIRSGLTETLRFPIAEHVNSGSWLVSAIIGNTTSSVQVLVSRPVIPSFDLKAIFQRFLLRTDKTLRGSIEINSDKNEPIFGRCKIAIGQITEQEIELKMKHEPTNEEQSTKEEWRQWKSKEFEIAGRIELNYDLLSLFNVDITKALAVQVYIQVTDLMSGQERIIRHIIPIFTHNIIYDIRPLEFEAGSNNEYEIIAKRPDGKPAKMEDMIVTIRMIIGDEEGKPIDEKSMEIKDFYTRGRNDIGFFNVDFPENCIGVLMTITPLGEDGKVRGYRTHALPLMPTPRRHNVKLSIELLPSKVAPVHTNVDVPVISSQISTVGRISNFYVQLIPSKPVEKFEPLTMSYVLMTNGRITLTGEFHIQPTKECQTKTVRSIQPEGQTPPACVFNGTLPIQITRDMVPYSTLLVYSFQPSFGFNVAESYRFSVAGLFQSSLTLNATIVPYTSTETIIENRSFMKEMNVKPIHISNKAQDKTRVELSFTGVPDSTVGLNVFEYDGILQGLSNEITKERLLKYLTTYEHVPIVSIPTMPLVEKTVRYQRQMGSNLEMDDGQGGMHGPPNGQNPGEMPVPPNGQNPGAQGEMPVPPNGQNPGAQGEMPVPPNGQNPGAQGGMPVPPNGPSGSVPPMNGQSSLPNNMPSEMPYPTEHFPSRRTISEEDEQEQIHRERMGHHVRYPIEKMVFGVPSPHLAAPVEGDDIYTTSNLGRFYGDIQSKQSPSHYRRKLGKSNNQYDVTVGDNDYVIATSIPLVFAAGPLSKPMPPMPPKPKDGKPPPPPKPEGERPMPPKPKDGKPPPPPKPEGERPMPPKPKDGKPPPPPKPEGERPIPPKPKDGKPLPPKPEGGRPIPPKPEHEKNEQEEPIHDQPSWFEKMNSKLNSFSLEAFKFMQSGLTIISDFDSLRIPTDVKRENLTKLFAKFREQSATFIEYESFSLRDEARQLLEEYMVQSDLSMIVPPIMLEEQSRISYHRSIFFNTSRIGSQGTGKIVLPQTKPYSTWLATGFALNTKSGLSVAQPIRLPTNQGLFVVADCPELVQVSEHVLLTYGINNYLGKDLTNVILRIRASADFDLIEQSNPENIVSSKDKDYTLTIPSLKSSGVEIRNLVLIPKRTGVVQIVIEVECEFGGDYEVLTIYVRESGIERRELTARLFDLTNEKKTYGPIVEKLTLSSNLRSVRLFVSGTGLDRFVKRYTMETNTLVGIDRVLVSLYRSLGLRRYLNETFQTQSPFFNMTTDNITTAYQRLQLYNDYDGSYSFISDEGTQHSSLYLTSLTFGAMISPFMPLRDNVTLNRTLNWILSHQQEDGSFEDNGPCFHYRFCSGKFRRESLTAIILYSLTRDNASDYMPEFIHHRLFNGENNPIIRAQQYLESRVPDVKSCLLTLTLFEMAFIQNRTLSSQLRERIHQALVGRQLSVAPEDGSRYLKNVDSKMTFEDQLLVNTMTISLYAGFAEFRTASDIARWVVDQIQTHPHFDTLLDAVFHTEAWLNVDCLFRKQFSTEKFRITVDVTSDNGDKKQFKIDSKNMDITQHFQFTLPVQQISYSVSGFGLVCVRIVQEYAEQQQSGESMPFQLTQEFKPMPWFSEIRAKTCMTYTPTTKDQKLTTENFNRTMVIEIELPSGMRINERQIGFFLSRVESVMYFTYEPCGNKLIFFINVPSTVFGKETCLDWCLERLSTVVTWAPIKVRTYDYLQPETQLVQLIPIQFQPALLGYQFVDAVHKARPTLESLPLMQKPKQV